MIRKMLAQANKKKTLADRIYPPFVKSRVRAYWHNTPCTIARRECPSSIWECARHLAHDTTCAVTSSRQTSSACFSSIKLSLSYIHTCAKTYGTHTHLLASLFRLLRATLAAVFILMLVEVKRKTGLEWKGGESGEWNDLCARHGHFLLGGLQNMWVPISPSHIL